MAAINNMSPARLGSQRIQAGRVVGFSGRAGRNGAEHPKFWISSGKKLLLPSAAFKFFPGTAGGCIIAMKCSVTNGFSIRVICIEPHMKSTIALTLCHSHPLMCM